MAEPPRQPELELELEALVQHAVARVQAIVREAVEAAVREAVGRAVHDERKRWTPKILDATHERQRVELELEADRERAAGYIARLWSLIAALLAELAGRSDPPAAV